MRWLTRVLVVFLALLLVAGATLWGWGAWIINRDYPVEARSVTPASDPAAIERGERLATAFGCFHGCHGKDMEGSIFVETPFFDRIVAPNLTRAFADLSPSELEAIIRQGVRPDGRSVIGMPSASFSSMTDEDLAAILGFIGQYAPQEEDLGRSRYGGMARVLLIRGEVKPAAADPIDQPWPALAIEDPELLGEYLALNACSECHGLTFEGEPGFTPPLTVAKAYSLEDFQRLMRTGNGLGDRDLGLMSEVAVHRFSAFTDEEVAAVHAFLLAR